MPTNVRVQPQTYGKLQELARRSGATMPQFLAEAIDELYRKRFLDECNAAYARLRSDPAVWERDLAERKAWEATLGDGLEDA
ncbi:MAG: ribbon-helix-helix protein, CopG family [Pirellulaceae bacterium]|nr:ribbon-helix-helix protein, CopG family [Pirellulaceae bacterium]